MKSFFNTVFAGFALGLNLGAAGLAMAADPAPSEAPKPIARESRTIAGWTVNISRELLEKDAKGTEKAIEMIEKQLVEINRLVPAKAVAELHKVPLWISPEYPKIQPRAEYHPEDGWLRSQGRDVVMAKGVEFTNVRIFEAEVNRMPFFVLHELAHAYHDRVIENGFNNTELKAAYEKAKASGIYDRVERWFGNGRPNTFERAYAMTNPQEYFAESTEAYFGRNDFFPFNRGELKRADPGMFALLTKLWGVTEAPAESSSAAPPASAPIVSRGVEPIPAFAPNARILFQGDSITDGNRGRNTDPNHILGHGYAFIIAARHGAAFAEARLDFLNRGVSGNTVLELEKRWEKETLELKPDVLSILIGVNDDGRGIPLDQFEKVYDKLIADAKTANPKLKLVLCEPFWKPTGSLTESQRKRQEVVAALAKKHGAALVRFQPVFDEAAKRAPADYWVWDNVHPTYRGHQLMADEWERAVREFWK